ncbi:hypothetical protein B0H21DRAFT_820333 [Amylocystis lapponica]|nr:hypothetical protein B0H21DRAFT_820333 [Amylocystis lapponica]
MRNCCHCAAPIKGNARVFECTHTFHAECVGTNTPSRCPVCRFSKNLRTVATVAGGALAGAALAAALTPAILGLLGFGPAGPVAASIAAGIQSGIGSVSVGSLFALCQSIAMGGALPCGVYAAGAVIGLAIAAAAAFFIPAYRGNPGTEATASDFLCLTYRCWNRVCTWFRGLF